MSTVLVVLQQASGKIFKASLCALTAAQELKKVWGKGDLVGLCLGEGAEQAAEQAKQLGLSTVLTSSDAALTQYRAVPYAAAVLQAVQQVSAEVIVAPATSSCKDFMPRVAAQFDAAQASEIIAVNSDGSLRRPLFAGNVFAEVELLTQKRCVTVRATAFAPAQPSGGNAAIQPLAAFSFDNAIAGEVVSLQVSGGGRPELGDAEVVVSGGRALQSSENFEKYIFPLADAFGAAVGASRAAVDSGYAPNDWQVGQTGKVVAPNLYVAVGISGAIQHLAGMKDSKVIVALNKDPDAPIFEVADYGLVGDLYQLVPQLTELVKKARSNT